MQTIYPVLLCGGSGTRLWPLSRKSYPKQFVRLVGDESLFMASARRFSGRAEGLHFARPTVLTHSDFRFIVTEQLAEAGIDPGAVLIEPEGKNTAPAILAAALHLAEKDPSAVMLVAPSDHVVPDVEAFHRAVAKGMAAVDDGALVTFGITPEHPETAYGYLELAEAGNGSGDAMPLTRIVEKPGAQVIPFGRSHVGHVRTAPKRRSRPPTRANTFSNSAALKSGQSVGTNSYSD